MSTGRVLATAVMAAVLALTATAGTSGANATTTPAPDAPRTDSGKGSFRQWAEGEFAPPRGSTAPRAVTYDRGLVPAGAPIAVTQVGDRRGMTIGMIVRGLRAGHTYGAHVHTRRCGPRPGDSGRHYQKARDPRPRSGDPRYANPRNEVWLDFTTDRRGNGAALSQQDWHFRPGGARSVTIHEHGTPAGPGHAGHAGRPVACLSVPFLPQKKR